MSIGKLSPRGLGCQSTKIRRSPRGLTCCRSTGNKTPRGLSAAMSLGYTISSWPWVVRVQGITLKTILGVRKTYHACLFFNLSLALLS